MMRYIKILDRICLSFIVVMAAMAVFWVMKQHAKKDQEVKIESNRISSRIKDLTQAEAILDQMKTARDQRAGFLETLNNQIPARADIGKFLKKLDGLIKERGLAMIRVQPLASEKGEHFTRIPIQLSLKGEFTSIYHFLHDLENMGRLIAMDKMIITHSSADRTCQVKLTTSIFGR